MISRNPNMLILWKMKPCFIDIPTDLLCISKPVCLIFLLDGINVLGYRLLHCKSVFCYLFLINTLNGFQFFLAKKVPLCKLYESQNTLFMAIQFSRLETYRDLKPRGKIGALGEF